MPTRPPELTTENTQTFDSKPSRRKFLSIAGAVAIGGIMAGCKSSAQECFGRSDGDDLDDSLKSKRKSCEHWKSEASELDEINGKQEAKNKAKEKCNSWKEALEKTKDKVRKKMNSLFGKDESKDKYKGCKKYLDKLEEM